MVFDNVVTKEKVMATQKINCCRKNVAVKTAEGEREYELKEPPIPDTINWENRYRSTKVRTAASWAIVCFICLLCYLLLGYVQYRQSQLESTYSYNIDCKVLYPSENILIYNALLAANDSKNYLTCYCKDLSLFSVATSQQGYCSAWQKDYITYKAVPLLLSLAIVLLNVVVGQIFRLLSSWERQKDAEREQISYAFKRGFLLMMNMGLVMILLNINYKNTTQLQEVSFIFLGKYTDFTSDWYNNIGGIIILTMVFNIAFSLIELALACTLTCLKRIWDTRCCTLETSRPTKDDYIALFDDEIYPIGERYAYLMATFMISMAFSGVIPILIPVTLLSFIFLYFADKFLLFKYYQRPIQYTHKLHHTFLAVLYVSLILHFGLTAFFLAEPTIIASGAYSASSFYSFNSSNGRLNNIFNTGYILPYAIMFFLLIFFAVFRTCVKEILQRLYEFYREHVGGSIKSAYVQKIKFFNILSENQSEILRRSLDVNMHKIELIKKERRQAELLFRVVGTIGEIRES
jgi:hypothetical protein